jgi:hypothetical protein
MSSPNKHDLKLKQKCASCEKQKGILDNLKRFDAEGGKWSSYSSKEDCLEIECLGEYQGTTWYKVVRDALHDNGDIIYTDFFEFTEKELIMILAHDPPMAMYGDSFDRLMSELSHDSEPSREHFPSCLQGFIEFLEMPYDTWWDDELFE